MLFSIPVQFIYNKILVKPILHIDLANPINRYFFGDSHNRLSLDKPIYKVVQITRVERDLILAVHWSKNNLPPLYILLSIMNYQSNTLMTMRFLQLCRKKMKMMRKQLNHSPIFL